MNDVVLKIEKVDKRFGAIQALAGVDLELKRGEWLGLLGPNGAGKTTLLRAVVGRLPIKTGQISWFGQPLVAKNLLPLRQRVGVVPQELALYPFLTAAENLATFGSLLGLKGQELRERVAWALEWTALADRQREKIKGFSGGMKRRLNIACSVLHRPEVVLLDEPTVGVDPQSRQRIWEMLTELQRGGASLLLTTHQLDEAQQLCERIAIVDHGRVVAAGSFAQLVEASVGRGVRVVFELEGARPELRLQPDGRHLIRRLNDTARELPALLAEIAAGGAQIVDIHIEKPSLQAVFLHFTGRELRE